MEEEQQLLMKLEPGLTSTDGNGHDDGGVTFVLVFSIFVSVCGSFICGYAMGYTSPVQSAILAELGLSTADYSLFGSLINVGGLLGSLVSGRLTDYIGRRGTMWLSDVLFLAGWFAITFSQDAWSLDIGRLALGMAMGLISYAVPVYVAEITPKNLRGGSVLLHQLMSSSGLAAVYIVGLTTSWRNLSMFGIVPCLIQLVKIGREKGFRAALQSLRGDNLDISLESAEIKEHSDAVQNISEDSVFNVFQIKYAYALVVTLGLMTLASLGGAAGFAFYASLIFESAGFPSTIGTIAVALIQLPPIILGVFLMDIFGRRPLLLYSAFGMCTACASVAISFLMKEHGWMTEFSPCLALFGFLICAVSHPVGLGGIPFVIMSEIFPINVKGAAGSLAVVVSFTSSWIVSYTFNFMMAWSSSGTFFIFTSVNVFALLFIAKLVPETKGRTLEELQESLSTLWIK